MEGRLPRGFCVKRLTDLPMLWSEQWRAIGLQEPVQRCWPRPVCRRSFQAVTIDGTRYWDGGYLANPALNPLLDYANDLLTILIDPLDVKGAPPVTPRQIVNRITEVSFNASWILEIQQIELINKLCKDGLLKGTKYNEKRLHLIRNDEFMEAIGATAK